jgi:hypothetical protein
MSVAFGADTSVICHLLIVRPASDAHNPGVDPSHGDTPLLLLRFPFEEAVSLGKGF